MVTPRRLFRAALALTLGAVALLVSGGASAGPSVPAPLHLSPNGSDGGSCTAAAPCRSLQRAYRLARKTGAVVELAGGDYGEQDLDPLPGRVAVRVVTFRRGGSGRPSFESLDVRPGVRGIAFVGLHFADGLDIGDRGEGPPARNLTFKNTTGARFKVMNAQSVAIVGGSYGPSLDNPSQIKVYNPDDTAIPRDIRVEGVLFHDYTRSTDDVHTECLQVYAGERISIRRNRFTNCDGTGSLALTTLSSTRLRNVLVENNWFDGRGDAYFAVQADESVENLVFRYNSGLKAMVFTECDTGKCGSAVVVGNYMPWNPMTCTRTARYVSNVFQGGRCAGSDTQVSRLDFVDPGGFDLHLKASANAICRGDWTNFPSRDLDGNVRKTLLRPDAGADHLLKRRDDKSLPRRCLVK